MINDVNISYGIRGGAVCAAFLVAGCADVEHGFSDRDMDRFVTAMISVDCKVDASNHETVEKATGFSTDKLTEITDYLKEKKLVTQTENSNGLILINEGCP